MDNSEILKETKRCCRELNKRIPCQTDEEIEDCTRVLDEYLSKFGVTRLFWDATLWYNSGKDVNVARRELMTSGEYKLCPSEEFESYTGIFVRKKSATHG